MQVQVHNIITQQWIMNCLQQTYLMFVAQFLGRDLHEDRQPAGISFICWDILSTGDKGMCTAIACYLTVQAIILMPVSAMLVQLGLQVYIHVHCGGMASFIALTHCGVYGSQIGAGCYHVMQPMYHHSLWYWQMTYYEMGFWHDVVTWKSGQTCLCVYIPIHVLLWLVYMHA